MLEDAQLQESEAHVLCKLKTEQIGQVFIASL